MFHILLNLKITNNMADIKTSEGYMQRFWELAAENQDYRDPMRKALICVESELQEIYGVRRYSSYDSFSAAKSRGHSGIRLTVIETV